MNNPFYYGNEVYQEDFCNRIEEIKELKNDTLNGINVLLYAPRRFGKTSLLKKLKTELIADNKAKVIYFDFFSISSIEEFVEKYFNASIYSLESKTSRFIENIKDIINLRANINVSLSSANEPVYGLNFYNKDIKNTLEDVLNLPFEYAKKKKEKIVVIFDEFQEISQFNLEKKLRSIIQAHSRHVSYIYSGSKKTIIYNMFSESTNAFYKSVKHFNIHTISDEDWKLFVINKFKKAKKSIEVEHIDKVLEYTKGFPYYTQQLFYVLWDLTDNKTSINSIKKAVDTVIERENDLYSFIYSELTPNQKKTLKYLTCTNGEKIFSSDNLISSKLTASTLKSTIDSLLSKDIIDRKDDVYFFTDPFFKLWIESYI